MSPYKDTTSALLASLGLCADYLSRDQDTGAVIAEIWQANHVKLIPAPAIIRGAFLLTGAPAGLVLETGEKICQRTGKRIYVYVKLGGIPHGKKTGVFDLEQG